MSESNKPKSDPSAFLKEFSALSSEQQKAYLNELIENLRVQGGVFENTFQGGPSRNGDKIRFLKKRPFNPFQKPVPTRPDQILPGDLNKLLQSIIPEEIGAIVDTDELKRRLKTILATQNASAEEED